MKSLNNSLWNQSLQQEVVREEEVSCFFDCVDCICFDCFKLECFCIQCLG